MDALVRDLRFAVRMLAKSPGFTAVVVVTLALGIGANTAIFSVVNATLLGSLPYSEPDRIEVLREHDGPGGDRPVSYPDYVDWREQQSAFDRLAFYRPSDSKLKTADGTVLVPTCLVSADFFAVLGVEAAQGRNLVAEDDRAGAALVAWLTQESRQRYFPGDQSPVGRTLLLDGQAVRVAGVLPSAFRFYRVADFYLPVGPYVQQLLLTLRGSNGNLAYVLGRLKPGATPGSAQAQMNAIAGRLERQYPTSNTGVGVHVVSLREHLAGAARPQLMLLLGAVGVVLMVACVNVANMLLSRSFTRKREMAIRTALGGTRPQLTRQLLAESVMLALVGGVVGAGLGRWGYELAFRLVPAEVRAVGAGAGLDLRMLLFVLAVSLATGIVFGLVPAWQSSHADPNEALKNAPPAALTLFGRLRVSDLLVVAQVALALTLVVGAGLLIRSLHQLMQVPSGVRPERVLTLLVESPAIDRFWRDPHSFSDYHQRVVSAVQSLPEVEAAAVATGLPFAFNDNTMPFYRDGPPVPRPGEFPLASTHSVSPDYFRAMGIPLLRGRLFDGRERPYVIPRGLELSPQSFSAIFKDVLLDGVISKRMADRYWPGEDPLGKRFRLGNLDLVFPMVQIVGVVGSTTQFGLEQGETTEFYLPLRQWPVPNPMHLVVRTRTSPAAALPSIRRAVQTVVSDQPVRDVQLMSERISGSVSGRKFDMGLFTSFAATALVLSLIGIYGVLSFAVSQRTREIGIQVALGARGGDVVRGVLARGLKLGLPGVLLGLAGAWVVGRLLRASLFGVTGTDASTYVFCTSVVLLAGFLACCLPALRAAKVDPLVALRCE
ncbi:MAG TPA: ABC transporter permease [Vicinamibacteria bacterium]|nr:ABC transporter permease [Vicinamibacteria bacterium]